MKSDKQYLKKEQKKYTVEQLEPKVNSKHTVSIFYFYSKYVCQSTFGLNCMWNKNLIGFVAIIKYKTIRLTFLSETSIYTAELSAMKK